MAKLPELLGPESGIEVARTGKVDERGAIRRDVRPAVDSQLEHGETRGRKLLGRAGEQRGFVVRIDEPEQ